MSDEVVTPSPRSAAPSGQQRWLLVDDHRMFADALVMALTARAAGLHIDVAHSAAAALTLLEHKPAYPLVIIDLGLPDMDGISLVELVKQSGVPYVLVCSADTRDQAVSAALQAGADGFISKTQGPEDVLAAVQRVMAGEQYVDEQFRPVAAGAQPPAHKSLSKRQLAILRLLKHGYNNAEISRMLDISPNTVKTHVRMMYDRIGAKNRLDCLAIAERLGLL